MIKHVHMQVQTRFWKYNEMDSWWWSHDGVDDVHQCRGHQDLSYDGGSLPRGGGVRFLVLFHVCWFLCVSELWSYHMGWKYLMRNHAVDLACFILHAVHTISFVSNRVPCLLEYCNAKVHYVISFNDQLTFLFHCGYWLALSAPLPDCYPIWPCLSL
jgi:hypothetical protein